MTEEADLVPGKFYWVMPAHDPDRKEEWEYYAQPARFRGFINGADVWDCIGVESSPDCPNDWPVRWIGEEIMPPDGAECPSEILTARVEISS